MSQPSHTGSGDTRRIMLDVGTPVREAARHMRDDEIDDAIAMMREHAIRRIPVVEDGEAVGIVTIGDLAVARDERSALADISAAPSNNG